MGSSTSLAAGGRWLLLALLASFPAAAQEGASPGKSRTVTLEEGGTATVRVRIAEASKNILSVVTFPESLQQVFFSWSAKDISVEHDGAKLFVKLFAAVEGNVDVTTTEGTHYRLYVVPVASPGEYDSVVLVKRASPKLDEGKSPKKSASGALELAKAMRLGLVPEGVTVRSGGRAVLFKDGDLEGTLLFVYEAPRFRGYVVSLSNLSSREAYVADLARFKAEDLVLLGAREVIVRPGKSTRLYLLFWKA